MTHPYYGTVIIESLYSYVFYSGWPSAPFLSGSQAVEAAEYREHRTERATGAHRFPAGRNACRSPAYAYMIAGKIPWPACPAFAFARGRFDSAGGIDHVCGFAPAACTPDGTPRACTASLLERQTRTMLPPLKHRPRLPRIETARHIHPLIRALSVLS